MNKKLIIIVGPNASGKSDLAVRLAKRFNGEVVSADSRQVYKGMDIGSGKITSKEMSGVPHHLLDVASPKKIFTVTQYRKLALKAISNIQKSGKLPILCGGTGFYINSIVDGIVIPEVKPDWKLRKRLSQKTPQELLDILKKIDPVRANNIEPQNPRRLIRAIEIVKTSGKPVPELKKEPLPYKILFLGIKTEPGKLRKKIALRLKKRLAAGMVKEVKKLRGSGISWQKLESFGLEYRYVAQYLQKKIKKDEMADLIQKKDEDYAKRQITWFKRQSRVRWIKSLKTAYSFAKDYLKNGDQRKRE